MKNVEIVILVLLTGCSNDRFDELEREHRETKSKLDKKIDELVELRPKLKTAQDELTSLRGNRDYEGEIASLNEKVKKLELNASVKKDHISPQELAMVKHDAFKLYVTAIFAISVSSDPKNALKKIATLSSKEKFMITEWIARFNYKIGSWKSTKEFQFTEDEIKTIVLYQTLLKTTEGIDIDDADLTVFGLSKAEVDELKNEN